MAKTGSFVPVNNVTPNLRVLRANTRIALGNGVVRAMTTATNAMARQVIAASTDTGARRAAGYAPLFKLSASRQSAWDRGNGPGRVESGRMLGSVGWRMRGMNGPKKTARVGFIDAPAYTTLQELGGGSGRNRRAIPPMMAFSLGRTVFAARFEADMSLAQVQAIRAAREGNRLKERFDA